MGMMYTDERDPMMKGIPTRESRESDTPTLLVVLYRFVPIVLLALVLFILPHGLSILPYNHTIIAILLSS